MNMVTVERAPEKRKKRPVMVSMAVLAAILLITCKMDMTEDSFPLPPELPVGVIVSSIDTSAGYINYSFALEWKRTPGVLSPDAKYATDDETIAEAMQEVYEKWLEYTKLINPLPFYGSSAGGPAPDNPLDSAFDVFVPGSSPPQLNNGPDKEKIVIHRYWPKSIVAGQPPTRAAWMGAEAERAAAFKKAVAKIEAMMASIEASPFYTTGLPAHVPLLALHQAMVDYTYNPSPATQRTEFSVSGAAAILPTGVSGPLYEYYMGYAPDATATDYSDPSGSVFPD